jgi:hypothetical protein
LIRKAVACWRSCAAFTAATLWHGEAGAAAVIQFITYDKPAFQIVQYYPNSVQAAKEKLLQFPAGTEFQWSVLTPEERAGKLYQELSTFATEHGMKITRKDQ